MRLGEAQERGREPWPFRDNVVGAHPDVLQALIEANLQASAGELGGYGNDLITRKATASMRQVFGERAETYIAPTGTFANVLGCSLAGPSPQIICSKHSHLVTMEGGGPEKIAHASFHCLDAPNGKITLQQLEALSVEQLSQAHMVHLTVTTELGTVYTPAELRAIGDFCSQHRLLFGIDGARLPHAAVAAGAELPDLTTAVGADFVTIAAAKCGGLNGNALIVLDREATAAKEIELLPERRVFDLIKFRGGGQSQMWEISVQLTTLFGTGLWRENVEQALARAASVRDGLAAEGIAPAFPIETNAVFLRMGIEAQERLGQHWNYFRWLTEHTLVRFMFSFNTPEHFGPALVRDLARIRDEGLL
jgi:threonine aldolase